MKKIVLILPLLFLTACATTSAPKQSTIQKDVYPVESTIQGFFDMQAKLTASFPTPYQKFSQLDMQMEIKNIPQGKKEVDGKQVYYSTSDMSQSGFTTSGEDYYTKNPFRYLGGYMGKSPYVVSNHQDLPKTAIVGSQGKFHDLTIYKTNKKKSITDKMAVNWTLTRVSDNTAKVCVIYENSTTKVCHIINQQGEVQYIEYHTSSPIIDMDAGMLEFVDVPLIYTNKKG